MYPIYMEKSYPSLKGHPATGASLDFLGGPPAYVSFISSQNVANCLYRKKKVGSSSRLSSFIALLFSPFFCCNLGDIGCILYNDADHYWSFDQSQIPQIADQRTGTEITLHGSPESKDSPTSKSLYLTDTTSVDLIEVTESSCLFDPSDCPTGFSITMFIKYRPRGSGSVDGFQMFFGNNDGIKPNQGISIYYNESTKHKAVNVTVFGSSDYCFRTFGKYSSSVIVYISRKSCILARHVCFLLLRK